MVNILKKLICVNAFVYVAFGVTNFTCPHPDRVVYSGDQHHALGDGFDFGRHRINRVSQFSEQDRLKTSVEGTKYNRETKLRVIDGFTFLNEIETLYIRLNELDEYVDNFVIIEATETFSGRPRTLEFPKAKESRRMKRFLHKIEYQVCVFPDHLKVVNNNERTIWDREHYIRQHCLRNALNTIQMKDEDLVIFGDIDEMPSGATIGYLSNCKVNKGSFEFSSSNPHALIAAVANRLHFNFHCRSPNMGNWPQPVIGFGSFLKHHPIDDMRGRRGNPLYWVLGGWHFSNFYYGNVQMLKEKYDGFSHQELQRSFKNDEDFWKNVVNSGGSEKINTHCTEYTAMDVPEYIFKRHKRYQSLLNAQQMSYALEKYPVKGDSAAVTHHARRALREREEGRGEKEHKK